MMKKFSAAFIVCLLFFSTVAFADQTVKPPTPSPEAIAAWKEAAACAALNRSQAVHGYMHCGGTYVHYRTSPNGIVTGVVGSSNRPQDYRDPNLGSVHYWDTHTRYAGDANSVSLCPPPRFRMTERDGCQPTR